MREDMVKVGAGLSKVADLAYRAQFTVWAMRIVGRINVSAVPLEWVPHLIRDAGMSIGIGDWRNEKNGTFGAFHLASVKEAQDWDAFAEGKGPLPEVVPFGGEDLDDVDLGQQAA
jgi:hypothetical protein